MVDVEFKILHSCKIMTLTDQTKPDITGFCQATIKENVETYKFKAFLPNVYLKAMPLSIKIQQGKTILDNLFEKNGIKSKKYTLLKWSQKNYGSKISLQPSIEFIQSLRSQRNKLPKSMAKGGESNLLWVLLTSTLDHKICSMGYPHLSNKGVQTNKRIMVTTE